MKVLVITPFYYIEGRENLFHDTNAVHYLLKYWPKDTEITVINEYHNSISHFPRYLKKEERHYFKDGYHFKKDGINVHMYELPILPKQKELFDFQKKFMVDKINNIIETKKLNPDVIICHQPAYYCSQYIERINSKAPKYAILHNSDLKELRRNSKYIKLLEEKFDRIYCRSFSLKNIFKEHNLSNISEDCIYSGVPTIEKYIKKNFSSKKLNIMYAGKFIKRKHVDYILEALGKVKNSKYDFKFRIIGKGPEYKTYKKIIKKLKLEDKVEFISHTSREDVYKYMGKSDIFVMPSTGETIGLVYLESMRQACIPIGTKNEGIDGVIKHGENGFLTKPDDINDLKEIFEFLLNSDSNDLKKLSKNAKKTGDLYTEEKIADDYYKIIIRDLKKK